MVLVRKLFADVLPLAAFRMNARLLAFALLLSMLTPVFFGLAPAISGSKLDVNETLKSAENVGRASRGSHRLREWLVVTEMILAVALLGVFGLFFDIWFAEARVKPGFDLRNMLTATLSAPKSAYPRPEDVQRFYRRLLERIDAVPGVERVGYGNDLPLFITAGRPLLVDRGSAHPTQGSASEVRVTPGFIEAMRIPLLRGRTLTEQDSSETRAIIGDVLARRAWPGQDPVGKRIKFLSEASDSPWLVVVGVVGDVTTPKRLGSAVPLVYRLMAGTPAREVTLVVRTVSPPSSAITAVRQAVWEVDGEQPLADLQTMEQIMREERSAEVRTAAIFGVFAGFGLALAALGVYSVMSCFVAERIPEIGVRMALGARPADVLRMLLCQGLRLALSGGVVGLLGAWILGRVTFHEVPQLRSSLDFLTIDMALLLSAVALLACYMPARRAARVDPVVALRYE
jgi:putative ABC transport system permease protein